MPEKKVDWTLSLTAVQYDYVMAFIRLGIDTWSKDLLPDWGSFLKQDLREIFEEAERVLGAYYDVPCPLFPSCLK